MVATASQRPFKVVCQSHQGLDALRRLAENVVDVVQGLVYANNGSERVI